MNMEIKMKYLNIFHLWNHNRDLGICNIISCGGLCESINCDT